MASSLDIQDIQVGATTSTSFQNSHCSSYVVSTSRVQPNKPVSTVYAARQLELEPDAPEALLVSLLFSLFLYDESTLGPGDLS